MERLLLKTRLLNKEIQNLADKPVNFNKLVKTLSEISDAHVVLIGKKGKIVSWKTPGSNKFLYKPVEADIEYLWQISEPKIDNSLCPGYTLFFVPVNGGGERLGTLIFGKAKDNFDNTDAVFFEYVAMVTGMEIKRFVNERKFHKVRAREALKLAMGVLSYSEIEALKFIFSDVNGKEAFLVASSIAKKHRLTRSVIVNAIRKLESAGVIDARSLGMKGTHVRILNPYFLEQIQAV